MTAQEAKVWMNETVGIEIDGLLSDYENENVGEKELSPIAVEKLSKAIDNFADEIYNILFARYD